MKNIFPLQRRIGSVALAALMAATAVFITSAPARADVAKIIEEAAKQSIQVVAPADANITYVLNGKTITVAAGETATLPPNATNIFLPEGAQLVIPAKSKDDEDLKYLALEDILLAGLTEEAVDAIADKLSLISEIKHPDKGMRELKKAINAYTKGYVNGSNVATDGE